MHLRLQADVQRREGLIQQQQIGREHQCPRQCGAALHATRELMRKLRQRHVVQPQQIAHVRGLRQTLAPGHTLCLQPQRDVVQRGLPGQQGGLLEQHGGTGKAVVDLAGAHIQQPGTQVQQRALAAA